MVFDESHFLSDVVAVLVLSAMYFCKRDSNRHVISFPNFGSWLILPDGPSYAKNLFLLTAASSRNGLI